MNTIDAKLLARMFLAGAKNLEVKKEWINELNVFPVPDGDTGTNMTLTIMSAVKEVNNLEDVQMTSLAKAISSGSLRGARGNSGVILSQLLRGFTKGIRDLEELDAVALARAVDKGVETAYKAVMKPKEGTILTVARGVADKALELAEDAEDLQTFLEDVLEEGRRVLAKTPDMLPVLKEAGVVDSGGQGLLTVLQGERSVTHYRTLAHCSVFSHLELNLETGRTHQIRVHMAYIGHPLLGDTLYNKTPGTFPRQALHSASLSFVHPITGEPLNFHAPLPEDMQNLLT